MKWTPMSDAPPPRPERINSHQDYLCTCRDGRVAVLRYKRYWAESPFGYRRKADTVGWSDDRGCLCEAPVAWARMPEGYRP